MKYVIIILTLSTFAACTSRKETTTTATAEEWKEMDAFHFILAEVYHPFKDSANLQPLLNQSAALVKEAKLWSQSALPQAVDNDTIKTQLKQVEREAVLIDSLVHVQDTLQLPSHLEQLHDTFHQVMESWYHHKGNHQH